MCPVWNVDGPIRFWKSGIFVKLGAISGIFIFCVRLFDFDECLYVNWNWVEISDFSDTRYAIRGNTTTWLLSSKRNQGYFFFQITDSYRVSHNFLKQLSPSCKINIFDLRMKIFLVTFRSQKNWWYVQCIKHWYISNIILMTKNNRDKIIILWKK